MDYGYNPNLHRGDKQRSNKDIFKVGLHMTILSKKTYIKILVTYLEYTSMDIIINNDKRKRIVLCQNVNVTECNFHQLYQQQLGPRFI